MVAGPGLFVQKPKTTEESACARIADKATPKEVFACGLICWTMATGPAIIGMIQSLADGGSASPSLFEMMFVAGGCCILPLTLLMNLHWTVSCWKLGAHRFAAILFSLTLLAIAISESGVG